MSETVVIWILATLLTIVGSLLGILWNKVNTDMREERENQNKKNEQQDDRLLELERNYKEEFKDTRAAIEKLGREITQQIHSIQLHCVAAAHAVHPDTDQG